MAHPVHGSTDPVPPRRSSRPLDVEKEKANEKIYAICIDDSRLVFKLKLFKNQANFPTKFVDDGTLQPADVRLKWKKDQPIKYFYADGDDDGNLFLDADILEICYGGEEEADAEVLRQSEIQTELSMLGRGSVGSNRSFLNGNQDFENSQIHGTSPVQADTRKNGMIGKNPLSAPPPKRKRTILDDDPDYTPPGGDEEEEENIGSNKSRGAPNRVSLVESAQNSSELNLQDLMRAIQTLSTMFVDHIKKDDKSKKAILDHVKGIERCVKTGVVSDLGGRSKQAAKENGAYIVKYVLDSNISTTWMGVDLKDRLEAFFWANATCSTGLFAKKLAEQMWGDRTIRYHKISLDDRQLNTETARLSLKKKDPQGFAIFESLIDAWDVAVAVSMTRDDFLESNANDETIKSAVEAMERRMKCDRESRVKAFLKDTDTYGYGAKDRKTRVKHSWYWDLIDQGHTPSSDWTVWDELVLRETAHLIKDRASISEENDEQSVTLKRVREFQEKISKNQDIDRRLYDKFGALI